MSGRATTRSQTAPDRTNQVDDRTAEENANVQEVQQEFDLETDPPQTPPFRQAAGIGGIGCLATQNIRCGTLILSEASLFDMPQNFTDATLTRKIGRLSAADQRRFLGLHAVNGHAILERRTFETNSIEMREGPAAGRSYSSGLFLQASRFNHSCIHNAYMQWNEKWKQVTIYAVREISVDEEIFVNYIPDYFVNSVERQIALQRYGFTCQCEACQVTESFGRESQNRRVSMSTLDRHISNAASHQRTTIISRHYEADIKSLLDLLEIEGLVFPGVADLYIHCSTWCYHQYRHFIRIDAQNDEFIENFRENTLENARKGLRYALVTTGQYSKVTKKALAAIEKARGL